MATIAIPATSCRETSHGAGGQVPDYGVVIVNRASTCAVTVCFAGSKSSDGAW